MTESIPPPIYSQEDPTTTNSASASSRVPEPQILINPTVDSLNFQKGFLGADDERAAFEGEVQIKGAEPGRWHRITMSLRTVEKSFEEEIELGSSDVVLFSSSLANVSSLPSSILFAVPLMPDAPQSIRTANSSLIHSLVVTLHPNDSEATSLTKSLEVHTRRYSGHGYTIPIAPETLSMSDPIAVNVQVPRTTFISGEQIPIYVTIPPPPRELVVSRGLKLRNVRAEFERVVAVKGGNTGASSGAFRDAEPSRYGEPVGESSSALSRNNQEKQSIGELSTFTTVLARSGASCRFHATRTLQLRFVLHQASPSDSPSETQANLPVSEFEHASSDAECPSISQSTLLHSITFRLNVYVSLVDTKRHTERIYTVTIPLTIAPPPAPLPEVAESIDTAYSKKHDRPPVRTNRYEDADFVPHYSEGEAGPSVIPFGAPPPFEERDAPPPFSLSEIEASTSNHSLPTFLESETEITVPSDDSDSSIHGGFPLEIEGEGLLFGFTVADYFDGHSKEIEVERSLTPPPTLEMAPFDTDVTQLADMPTASSIEELGIAFEHQEGGHDPPPPPPAMDDPSDPPPSIDSDFRIHDTHSTSSSPEPSRRSISPGPDTPIPMESSQQSHDPPPYRVPLAGEQEHVSGPPPYVG